MSKSIPKHSLTFLCSIALGAVLFSPPTGGTAQARDIPPTININTQLNLPDIAGLAKDKKHVNSFSHQKHAETYLKGKAKFSSNPYTDEFTCAACHPGSTSREDLLSALPSTRLGEALNKQGGPKKLKKYFHGICRSCHKKLHKAGLKSGPTNCKGCHGRH